VPQVYLGLGSNIGDRLSYINQAIDLLSKKGLSIDRLSSIIETDPIDGPPQGKFLNAVLKSSTQLTPEALLVTIKKIEKQLSRQATVVNGPRTIDIDILFYDNLKVCSPKLTIPHPRLYDRDFVLIPLNEIYPNFPDKNSL
jgi:2-amino-4-hydroxy-6-hydroxymethyldihydropteridine diphosphokinase